MPYRSGVCAAALATAVAGVLPSAVLAQDAAPVRITRYGTFEVRQEMPAHDRKAGATGVTKLMTIVDPYLLERTSRLEARLCRRFGIWFDLPYGVPGFPASVTIRLTHPVLVRPDGRSGTVETWPTVVDGTGGAAGAGGQGGDAQASSYTGVASSSTTSAATASGGAGGGERDAVLAAVEGGDDDTTALLAGALGPRRLGH